MFRFVTCVFGFILVAAETPSSPAWAEAAETPPRYDFSPPASTNDARIFRVNRETGQVGACQFAPSKDGKGIGETFCFTSGEGATPQETRGEYSLTNSNATANDGAIYRVNKRTGEISICYLTDASVLCTPPR